VTVETWLDGFSGDLYGRTLAIDFYCYLRPEHKFASVEELKEEIFRNQKQAAAWFAAHRQSNSGYTIPTNSQQRSVFE
jgi:riboflavin kinase/FMN adenylyltransferase